MLLIIDNYDSFTYNLVQYFEELGSSVTVYFNDKISITDIQILNPKNIVISPGPGRPEEAGVTMEVIKTFSGKIPLLGVCLGHQAIAKAFGAEIVLAQRVMHGKTSPIYHNGKGMFRYLKNPFKATRYHSLLIDLQSLPAVFEITAWTEPENEIMGIRHKDYLLEGVQFHPESVLTERGYQLLKNFLDPISKCGHHFCMESH
ncbi:anthranilate synthase component II [Coxiella endosymbiont of Amblyomma nuttalli]|uniref:anthranilate synthase component II n=1 Tax=Coxiella endosymbiont of Amblyomma nuttalli TaxID=2749996 RepID=UPI001BAC89F7|nr:aminodeoxychorismate/anthranilate synthase component II [Coxiella endosymbiont of Amblyomma nuttalli]